MHFIKQQILLTNWNELINSMTIDNIKSHCNNNEIVLYDIDNACFYISDIIILPNIETIFIFNSFDRLPDSEKEKYKFKLDDNDNYYYSRQNYYNKIYDDLHNMNILDALKDKEVKNEQ